MTEGQTPAPWVLVRARLAEAWHCAPWDIDESPAGEVEIQLTLWEYERKYRPEPKGT